MVCDLASFDGGRPDLNRANPAGFSKAGVNDRFVPRILTDRVYGVRGRLYDQVRSSAEAIGEVPHGIVGKDLGRRHVFGIALRRAAIDPADDRVDLLVGERTI